MVLALAAVLAITSGGTAATRRGGGQAQVERLTKQVAHLRAQLRSTRLARDKARTQLADTAAKLGRAQTELASSQAQAETWQAQASQLQGTLTQTAGQLSAAQERASGLQAQLDAIPSPLSVAISQVRREVAYVKGGLGQPYGQLISEAALDYTVGHVSDTAYGYLEWFGGTLPGFDPNTILSAQAGICGQAANVFAAIVSAFGLPVRSVQFFYDNPDGTAAVHVTVEVSYDGGWHYFDPTYGEVWTDGGDNVLSIDDVRAGAGTLQKDVASFTNVFEDAVLGDDTWFVTDPATTVVIGAAKLA